MYYGSRAGSANVSYFGQIHSKLQQEVVADQESTGGYKRDCMARTGSLRATIRSRNIVTPMLFILPLNPHTAKVDLANLGPRSSTVSPPSQLCDSLILAQQTQAACTWNTSGTLAAGFTIPWQLTDQKRDAQLAHSN